MAQMASRQPDAPRPHSPLRHRSHQRFASRHGTWPWVWLHTAVTFSSNILTVAVLRGKRGALATREGPLMIEVRNLSKYFRDKKCGEIRAVDGVSFRCLPGQIYGLLGANGAGKTTTLRMLATILEPTGGTAIVCGHDIVEHPEKVRSCVGFLSTATALYPRLTARELGQYFGRLNGLDDAILKTRVEKIFDVIGIIQNGKLLAEGTLQQLRDKYGEQELEEIFVKVVAPHYVSSEDH